MLGLWVALTIAAAPDPAEVVLTAERLLHDGQRELTTAEGGAKLVTEGAAVDAERIVFDKQRNVATATGHVVARLSQGGKIAVIADVVTLRFDDAHEVKELFLFDGQAIAKKDVPLERFLAADTLEKVKAAGTTQALLGGNHLVRDGAAWTVEQLELVPCECDFEKPSWSISSSTATIDTADERVAITNPVVRIKQVPVLWLPWLSLPLTDRQSGLLVTRPDFGPLNGFSLLQPVFLTAGRSADFTLTPGFFTGGTGPNGVQGPKLTTEFRYVPSARASGRAVLGLLYDFRTRRDVENAALREVGSVRGWRGELLWQHTQDFDRGFAVRVDLNGHSDGDYNRDNTIDVVASSVTYLRSSATAFHRGDDHYLGVDVGLRQDIQWGYDWLGEGTLLAPGRVVGPWGPATLQRLPVVTFGWAPSTALGPLRFSLEGEAARLAPLFSLTGDEGSAAHEGALEPTTFKVAVDRLFSPSTTAAGFVRDGLGNRTWKLGEREARDRLMALPRLSFAAQPGGVLSISASAAWRQLAWLGEASGRSWSRGYLLLGGAVETELARRFGVFRHSLQPRVEVRSVPFGYDASSSGAPPVPYDPLDFAVPNTQPRVQGIVELRQRLLGAGGVEHLRLDLGQGFEWASSTQARVGEAYGRVQGRVGWVSAQGVLRVDPLTTTSDPITRLAGRLDVDDGRGHGAYVTYENVLMEGTARTRQPLDLLFLIDRGYTSSTRVRQVTFGARWNFGPVSAAWDAILSEQLPKNELKFTQHRVGVGLTPACDCWRVDLYASQLLVDDKGQPAFPAPSMGFNVTVSRFGSIR